MVRLLTFSTLYPNAIEPQHGIFVEQRLRHFLDDGDDRAALVVAPVPWFPLSHPAFGRYGSWARVPAEERRHGIRVLHPRYPVLPKIGMSVAPYLMAAALRPTMVRQRVHERVGRRVVALTSLAHQRSRRRQERVL